jgi:hypothetical protein
MNHIQFIEELVSLGYKFFVVPENDKVIVEVSFNQSFFSHDEELAPPKEIPQVPYKIYMARDEEYDEISFVFAWTFELNEWLAEPPRQ